MARQAKHAMSDAMCNKADVMLRLIGGPGIFWITKTGTRT